MTDLFSLQLPTDRTLQLQSLFRALDPVSILSQNLNSDGRGTSHDNRLHLIPEDDEYAEAVRYVFLRGPRYNAYAQHRESHLLKKHQERQRVEEIGTYAHHRESHLLKKHRERERVEEIGMIDAAVTTIPPRKQVKFQNLATATTRNMSSAKDVKVSNFVESGRVGGRKVSSIVAQSVPDFSAVLRKENRRPPAEITLTPPSTKKGSPGMGSGWSAKGSRSAGAAEKRAGGAAARKSYASLEELRGSTVRAANAICGGPGDGKRRILGSRKF